jgi:ADP-L-glycero-D-manno-heptose 6-epimerase
MGMIIVTGGAGLIGSAVVWRLNQMGHENIVIVDHLGTTDKWANLAPLKFKDYLEKEDLLPLLAKGTDSPVGTKRVRAIIHLGACSSTTERDASYLIRNNFEYSKQLARFAMDNNARFIYASSAATYGDGELGFDDEETQLNRLRPLNGYGYSKQIFDLWLQQHGLLDKVVGLKYFNVYGPNEHHKGEMRSVVLKAFEQVQATGGMTLFRSHKPEYKDGEQLRDFVYVKDAVDMTLFFLEHLESNGIFNIGTGQARSWNDLANALFMALGKPANISYLDMPEHIRPRYQYYTCAENAKLKAAGYGKAATTLEEAIKDYVQGYLLPGKHLGDEQG